MQYFEGMCTMKSPYVQELQALPWPELMARLRQTTDNTPDGLVAPVDCLRLLGYAEALLRLDTLTASDRAACKRYLGNERDLIKAEARRIGVMRRRYNRKAKR